jgi:hypothetical protein
MVSCSILYGDMSRLLLKRHLLEKYYSNNIIIYATLNFFILRSRLLQYYSYYSRFFCAEVNYKQII